MAALYMLFHVCHKSAVHVDKPAAAFAFQMEMAVAALALVKLI